MDVDNTPIGPADLAALSRMPEVERETRALARDIARDARQLAPRRTGNLARHGIGVDRRIDRRTREVVYAVGWTEAGWYGWLVENGTEHSAPRPHLVPAAIRNGAVAGGGDG